MRRGRTVVRTASREWSSRDHPTIESTPQFDHRHSEALARSAHRLKPLPTSHRWLLTLPRYPSGCECSPATRQAEPIELGETLGIPGCLVAEFNRIKEEPNPVLKSKSGRDRPPQVHGMESTHCSTVPGAGSRSPPSPKQKDTSADGDDITISQDPKLAILSIDPRPVGAIQVGQNQDIVIFLNFHMKSADALVVQLNRISFFAAMVMGGRMSAKTLPLSAPCITRKVNVNIDGFRRKND